MKIALCTTDFFHPVQESIRKSGHQVEEVITCDLSEGFSDKTAYFAREMRAKLNTSEKVTEDDLARLEDAGVELLIAAGFDQKIPTPENSSIKLINVHGSLLPEGRGPWPQPWILLNHPEAAGVTFHSMTQEWDVGDILLQRKIALEEEDNLNSLVSKVLLYVRQMSRELLSNFEQIWRDRRPMVGKGSYWKKPTPEQRTLSLESDVSELSILYRAFGQYTLFKSAEQGLGTVAMFSAWKEQHHLKPGTLVTVSPPREIYAVNDGFLSVSINNKD